MDLITTSVTTDCTDVCCSASPETLNNAHIIMPSRVMNLGNSVLNNEDAVVLLDENIEGTQASQVLTTDAPPPVLTQTENMYNMEAICKLKMFIECAEQAAAHFELLLNLPISPNAEGTNSIRFPSKEPLIVKSLEKSSSKTPESKKIRFDSRVQTNSMFNSDNFMIGRLEKPASREIDVYRTIPLAYKIFFPLIHDFHVDPEDPKMHIFDIEVLKPLWEKRGLSSKVRTTGLLRNLILEAATFSVHILFDLLILHEKVGYVHSDVSPSNIMFSERLNIWKLMDFDLSLPIEESLKSCRRSGTRDYKAPESIRTGIWSQASDVFALGKVVYNYFCDEMKRFKIDESNLPALKELNQLVQRMCENNPDQRITVRAALKSFIDFILKYKVPYLQIYGYHLIFPLAVEELKNNSPASL